MQRRIERVQSGGSRGDVDFRVSSKQEDATIDFTSLSEDHIIVPIIQKIRESSITPTTFVSREFQNSFDDQWYIEQYAYKNNNVVRFGINHLSDQVFSSLARENVPLFDVTSRAASTAKSSGKYTKEDATQISLCELETLLLDKACNHLLTAEEDTKAVLVDIFVRVNGGTSNGCVKHAGRVPEIHTVVLYKNPTIIQPEWTAGKGELTLASTTREITVVDPSNFIFSSHLSNYNNACATGHEGEVSFTIHTIHKAIQIYQPVTKDIGPAPSQSRDCTDIACKLALGLNQINTALQLLTYEDIKTCQIIQNLSNISGIDPNIINTRPQLTVRIKQTSDKKIVDLFNKLEHLISNELEIISKLDSGIETLDIKNEVIKVLSDEGLNSLATITALYQCNIQCNTFIGNLTASIMEEINHKDIEIVSMMGDFDIGGLS